MTSRPLPGATPPKRGWAYQICLLASMFLSVLWFLLRKCLPLGATPVGFYTPLFFLNHCLPMVPDFKGVTDGCEVQSFGQAV